MPSVSTWLLWIALLCAAANAFGGTPADELAAFTRAYDARHWGIAPSDYVYGALIFSADAKRQYDDIMAFPPFALVVDRGKAMWETPFRNGKTYAGCFPNGGRNAAGNYPYFDDARGKVVTFEMALNDCRQANGEPELDLSDMHSTGVLTAYARSLSDGMAMNIKVESPQALAAFDAGRRTYFARRGQLDFSCAICHVDQAGRHIRNEFLSPAIGQATHWPVFRAPGDVLTTLQYRYHLCYTMLRAKPPAIGSEEFNNLEYFHSYLSNGLPLKASVFRK